jgi:hypothetical protein
MIGVCELQAKNEVKSTKICKLAVVRKKFYGTLLNSRPRFAGTYLEHIILNEAAKKLFLNKAGSHGS